MKQKDLDRLIAQWDRRLAKSGFEDIEDRKTGLLKTWSGYTQVVPGTPEGLDAPAQAEYYRQASHLLHMPNPLKGLARRVWGLHVQGLALSAIAQRIGIPRSNVQYYVDKVRAQYLHIYTGTHKHKKQAR